MRTRRRLRNGMVLVLAVVGPLAAGCSKGGDGGPNGMNLSLKGRDVPGRASKPTSGQFVVYADKKLAASGDVDDSGKSQVLLPDGDYDVVATGNGVICGLQDVTVSDGTFTPVTFLCHKG